MASIQAVLSEIFSVAFTQCGFDARYGQVVESQRPDLCQFQCNGALAAAKNIKKNPREIAQKIMTLVEKNPALEKLSIAGPGFINISVADNFLASHMNTAATDERLGCYKNDKEQTIIIDFGGPNVAKPMHVGHLRNAIIGQCFTNLYRFCGNRVITDNHLGDWGTQMGMLICAIQELYPQLPYFDPSYSGAYPQTSPVGIDELEKLYPQANSRCKSDPQAMACAQRATVDLQNGRTGYIALWKHFVAISVQRLKVDFEKLGVSFDYWLGESFYQQRMSSLVKRLRDSGSAQMSEGALILQVSQEGDSKEVPPLLLMKSDGAFLYGTSDLATLEYRMETFAPARIIYVVDIRQSLHFLQVFRAARLTHITGTDVCLEHAGFGTVNGPDGKPFKTREGNAMQLGDLLDMVYSKALERMAEAGVAQECDEQERRDIARKVGLAALRFADLQNNRESDYIFDPDRFLQFEGKTGPYLLYSAVRIKSILRNAADKQLAAGKIIAPAGEAERGLMLVLGQLPDVIHSAAQSLAPHLLCDWAYTVSQQFNRFYRDCHVLREEDRARQSSWLSLIKLTLDELSLSINLLGMETPERM